MSGSAIRRKAVKTRGRRRPREPLTRNRVIAAAIAVADRESVDAVTMRRLGLELGVEAMSLYHHVSGKGDVFDAILATLMDSVPIPERSRDWRATIRARALAARAVFRPHPWAARLFATRGGANAATLRYVNWVVGVLRVAGFRRDVMHAAVRLIGARVLGLDLEPFADGSRSTDAKALRTQLASGEFPELVRAMSDVSHADDRDFVFGLDVILDGLERARRRHS